MLRIAARVPARNLTFPPRCGDGFGQQLRPRCRLTRPARAAEAPKGDGISMEIEYSGAWGWLTTFPKRKPYATNIIVATVKTSIADIIVQKFGEGKEQIDWGRNGVFTAFGFAYLGVVQWFIYVTLFKRLCPNAVKFANMSWAEKKAFRPGQIDLLKQTAYDNFVHYTFIYYPVFYMFKESIQGNGVDADIANRALSKYWKNIIPDNMAMWGLWIPFDLIIYAVPIWMRLPLNHTVSLAWTMILSYMRGSEK